MAIKEISTPASAPANATLYAVTDHNASLYIAITGKDHTRQITEWWQAGDWSSSDGKPQTHWLTVTCFGRGAAGAARFGGKGDPLWADTMRVEVQTFRQ